MNLLPQSGRPHKEANQAVSFILPLCHAPSITEAIEDGAVTV